MKKYLIKAVLFITALSFAISSPAKAYNDPSSPPGFPQNPPPLSQGPSDSPSKGEKPVGKAFKVELELKKGWNIISFPFSAVIETSGFKYKLLRYCGGRYYTVDAAAEPEEINTRWGYIAYSDNDGTAWAAGLPNNGEVVSASFDCGWNLAGSPSLKPPPWNRLVASIGSARHRLLDVAGSPDVKKNFWISSKAFRYDGAMIPVYLTESSNARTPGKGLWFYAWHPFTITVMHDEKNNVYPEIKTVKPSSASPGKNITVKGEGFGDSLSTLCISGVPVAPGYIKSWNDKQILFTLPSYAMTGDLVAYSGTKPSNPVKILISDDLSASRKATLEGKVQDKEKNVISGALVALENGMTTYSDMEGKFSISNIPQGKQGIQVSKAGHCEAKGKVDIPASGNKTVILTLPWADSPHTEAYDESEEPVSGSQEKETTKKGNLYAVATAGTVDGKRWWVYHIRVTEWENYNYTWENTWYTDYGDTYYELKCPGARIGKVYNFYIEWRRKIDGKVYVSKFSRKMYKDDQRENFDRPW